MVDSNNYTHARNFIVTRKNKILSTLLVHPLSAVLGSAHAGDLVVVFKVKLKKLQTY